MSDMDLQLQPFSAINLADPFFDSLKAAYPEFAAQQSFRFVGEELQNMPNEVEEPLKE